GHRRHAGDGRRHARDFPERAVDEASRGRADTRDGGRPAPDLPRLPPRGGERGMSALATIMPADEAAGRVDADNPSPGLAAFREEDRAFFHGRDSETEGLFRCVLRERLTVLFGLAGLGKTSLLHAGLFPRLRERNVLPVSIRLDHCPTA